MKIVISIVMMLAWIASADDLKDIVKKNTIPLRLKDLYNSTWERVSIGTTGTHDDHAIGQDFKTKLQYKFSSKTKYHIYTITKAKEKNPKTGKVKNFGAIYALNSLSLWNIPFYQTTAVVASRTSERVFFGSCRIGKHKMSILCFDFGNNWFPDGYTVVIYKRKTSKPKAEGWIGTLKRYISLSPLPEGLPSSVVEYYL